MGGVFIVTSFEIVLIGLQLSTAVMLVALLVANAKRAAQAREFEERAATHTELARTAERLTAQLEELEGRLAGKTDIETAIADLPRLTDLNGATADLAAAVDTLPKAEDMTRAMEPLARKTDLQDALQPYPTSADFNALMESLLARQTSEVAHRLDILADEVTAVTQNGNGTAMPFPPEVGGAITQKSIDAAMALFDASEELITAAAIPLAELPRDGGASIVDHQQRCQSFIDNVLSAQRAVHMLFPEESPVRTGADAVCGAAERTRDALRANYETMNRAALNGADPGRTSMQRLAHRQAEQRALDAQSQYAQALAPVRDDLSQAFDHYSTALNTQIHGAKSVDA